MFDLVITEKQRRVARANHAVGVIIVAPWDFLRLTTTNDAHRKLIQSQALDLDQYNRWSLEGEIVAAPYIDVDINGRVVSHEGRHRAAAMMKREYGQMPVVVYARPSKSFDVSNIPIVLIGQFNTRVKVPVYGIYSLTEA
jgi:hypothetical protein